MPTTITIIMVGVAIGYQKDKKWHVMFPVDKDECHKIDFSYQKANGSPSSKISLANSTLDEIPIAIELTGSGAISKTSVEWEFTQDIYNLTSSKTHSKIRLKDKPEKFALMTIPNALFSVNGHVSTANGPIPDLVEVKKPQNRKPITTLAHSAKGTIILNDDAQVVVKVDGTTLPGFPTDAGSSYTLTFNNDCEKIPIDENDMDLYYDIIEEFDPNTDTAIDRQFRIGGVGIAREKLDMESFDMLRLLRLFKDPPDVASMAIGNTCLFAQVTDEDSIKKLP